jgi:hypothetical protein
LIRLNLEHIIQVTLKKIFADSLSPSEANLLSNFSSIPPEQKEVIKGKIADQIGELRTSISPQQQTKFQDQVREEVVSPHTVQR